MGDLSRQDQTKLELKCLLNSMSNLIKNVSITH